MWVVCDCTWQRVLGQPSALDWQGHQRMAALSEEERVWGRKKGEDHIHLYVHTWMVVEEEEKEEEEEEKEKEEEGWGFIHIHIPSDLYTTS